MVLNGRSQVAQDEKYEKWKRKKHMLMSEGEICIIEKGKIPTAF